MKPITSFFVLMVTAAIFSNALATDTATHTIDQQNHQYDYGLVKGIEKPAYVITPKPFADPIIDQNPSHKNQIAFPKPVTAAHVVHFQFGSSELSNAEVQKLDQLVTIVGKQPVISVTGYTCPKGTFEVNDRLAWDRARTVTAWLKKQGIKVRRISGKPKCCYVSTEHPAENRRVEIVFNTKPD